MFLLNAKNDLSIENEYSIKKTKTFSVYDEVVVNKYI